LKRLSVTAILQQDLERPPVLGTGSPVADARTVLEGSGSRWAVVIDAGGTLRGWVGEHELEGDGLVGDRAHRMEATVQVSNTLKQAFSEMLKYDAGWVAVLDGADYLGVLTPDSLHAALRRSIERADGSEPEPSPLTESL
jgi:osmoprotectant transport system ATP-binding protein